MAGEKQRAPGEVCEGEKAKQTTGNKHPPAGTGRDNRINTIIRTQWRGGGRGNVFVVVHAYVFCGGMIEKKRVAWGRGAAGFDFPTREYVNTHTNKQNNSKELSLKTFATGGHPRCAKTKKMGASLDTWIPGYREGCNFFPFVHVIFSQFPVIPKLQLWYPGIRAKQLKNFIKNEKKKSAIYGILFKMWGLAWIPGYLDTCTVWERHKKKNKVFVLTIV
jgi:hypothetical protein